MTHEQEIQQLREELHRLRERLDDVSRRLEVLQSRPVEGAAPAVPPPLPVTPAIHLKPRPPEPPPVLEAPPVIAPPPPLSINHQPLPIPPKESFEVRLGTVWLPRIGIALVLTGMTFFAAYYFPRLNAAQKVALSYVFCGVLCGLGVWLEKRTQYLARVLFAGGLALTYFVTYAAHHIKALQVIDNPAVGITLLSLVVVGIITVAQNRQSALLAGLALFFGYYTSIISEVATFTLAANALLAVAAIFFLWRNRWVHISYLAVMATYLAYMLWVWQLNRGVEVGRILFDRGYLSAGDFQLRAAFLSLYWVLFSVGGLIVNRDALELPERKGLLTLNNSFFFILFALLMHHGHPDRQWVFLFCYGGALLVTSAIAFQRLSPDRTTMDLLFLQGVMVATLGILDYFQGAHLVAALAVESIFLLLLARALASRWIVWVGRAVYAIAALVAWHRYPGWDNSMLAGVWFAAVAGYVGTRLTRSTNQTSWSAIYYAVLATLLAMTAGREQFPAGTMSWVWLAGAIVVAGIGAALRTREIVWASHLPLVWAFLRFLGAAAGDRPWLLDQSLGLIVVLLSFGIVAWGRERAGEDEVRPVSERSVLLPYAVAALIVAVLTTVEYCPARWRLATFAVEAVVLVGAGIVARERTFFWLGVVAAVVGCLKYLGDSRIEFDSRYYGWVNLACSLWILGGIDNLVEWRGRRLGLSETTLRWTGAGIISLMAIEAIFAIDHLVDGPFLSVSWAVCGFAFLIVGFASKERPYRIGGLVALGFALLRVVFYDLSQMSTPQRILSFIVLGVLLLVLAYLYAKNREKLARWL